MLDCLSRILDDKLDVQFPHDSRIRKFFARKQESPIPDEMPETVQDSWVTL